MASAAVAVGRERKRRERERAQALRRYAMEPIKIALKREGRPQTWLMRQMADRGGMQVKQALLCNYLNGWNRVPREFVRAACLIAGANPGDVYARIAGHESVLFQPEQSHEK